MQLIGDCRDEELVEEIFGSVSGFAYRVELLGDEFQFSDVKVTYDPKEDIHYFWS